MPKLSFAELHGKYMEARVPVCDQGDDGHGPIDHQDHTRRSQQDYDGHDKSGSISRLNFPVALMSSTYYTPVSPPNKTCSTTLETPHIRSMRLSSLPSPPSLPSLPSLSSTSPLPSLSTMSSDNSSLFASGDAPCLRGRIYAPQEAKEISLQDESYCAIAEQKAGLDNQDNVSPAGMGLEDHKQDLSVYCVTTE